MLLDNHGLWDKTKVPLTAPPGPLQTEGPSHTGPKVASKTVQITLKKSSMLLPPHSPLLEYLTKKSEKSSKKLLC